MKYWNGLGANHPLIETLDPALRLRGYTRLDSDLDGSPFAKWNKPFFEDVELVVTIYLLPRSIGIVEFTASIDLCSRVLTDFHNSIEIWECGHPIFMIDQRPSAAATTIIGAEMHALVLNGSPKKMRTVWSATIANVKEAVQEFETEYDQYVVPFVDSVSSYEQLVDCFATRDSYPFRDSVSGFATDSTSLMHAFLLSRIGKITDAIEEIEVGKRIAIAEIERDWGGPENAVKRHRRQEIVACRADKYRDLLLGQLESRA
jgi:hypothetical protein